LIFAGSSRQAGSSRSTLAAFRPPDPVSATDRIAAVMDAAGPQASELLLQANTRISELASDHEGAIGPFAKAAATDGGKRLRPLLAVLSAGLKPADPAAVVRAAAAVELVHAATLVHDDILDRANLRRGRPTVVAQGGRGMAVAVGDLLFAVAFGELVENGAQAVSTLAMAGSDLARGELLQRADAWRVNLSEERFLKRCHLKTARLFEAAASLGAQAGGMDPELPRSFGRDVGLAFQLLDDVLDVSGPPEVTGKPRGADLLDGTVTLPLILAIEKDPSLAAVDLRGLDEESAARICDRIEETGALDVVRARAQAMVDSALATAQTMNGWASEAFSLVALAVVDRDS